MFETFGVGVEDELVPEKGDGQQAGVGQPLDEVHAVGMVRQYERNIRRVERIGRVVRRPRHHVARADGDEWSVEAVCERKEGARVEALDQHRVKLLVAFPKFSKIGSSVHLFGSIQEAVTDKTNND